MKSLAHPLNHLIPEFGVSPSEFKILLLRGPLLNLCPIAIVSTQTHPAVEGGWSETFAEFLDFQDSHLRESSGRHGVLNA